MKTLNKTLVAVILASGLIGCGGGGGGDSSSGSETTPISGDSGSQTDELVSAIDNNLDSSYTIPVVVSDVATPPNDDEYCKVSVYSTKDSGEFNKDHLLVSSIGTECDLDGLAVLPNTISKEDLGAKVDHLEKVYTPQGSESYSSYSMSDVDEDGFRLIRSEIIEL